MPKLPMVSMHFFMPIELIQELDKKVESHAFPTRADALRGYCQLGLRVEQFKTEIKNPEFLRSVEDLKKNDALFEWLATLTPQQEDALAFAIKTDRERRHKQERFL